jgi:hypothetical protein
MKPEKGLCLCVVMLYGTVVTLYGLYTGMNLNQRQGYCKQPVTLSERQSGQSLLTVSSVIVDL